MGGLVSTAIVIFGLGAGVYTLANFSNLRWVGPATGLFFIIAAIPTFLWVRERTIARAMPPGENFFDRRQKAQKDLHRHSGLQGFGGSSGFLLFCVCRPLHRDRFCLHLRRPGHSLGRLNADPDVCPHADYGGGGALLFGLLQDSWGAKRTFILTLLLWVAAVSLIYGVSPVTEWLSGLAGTPLKEEHVFLMIGAIAGLGLGSTQSACRAMVGLFSPDTKAGEFFGLWSLTSRLSAIAGLMGLGVLQAWLGLHRAILVCSAFFFIAVVIVLFVDEERGKRTARAHAGE